MGGIHPLIDVVGIRFQIVDEGGFGEEVDVIPQGGHHRATGVAQAARGHGAEGIHVVGAAKSALLHELKKLLNRLGVCDLIEIMKAHEACSDSATHSQS